MKNLIIIVLILFSTTSFAQKLTLDFCVGTWKYTNSSTGEEFTMKLKKALDEIPSALGGGMMDCLIGVYAHKKNGVALTDCLDQFTTINAKSSPIWTLDPDEDGSISFLIKDFKTKNGWGKTKNMGGASRLYFHSQSPKQIRMVLVDNGKGDLYFDERDIFPRGTSLPTDIVLTKIE